MRTFWIQSSLGAPVTALSTRPSRTIAAPTVNTSTSSAPALRLCSPARPNRSPRFSSRRKTASSAASSSTSSSPTSSGRMSGQARAKNPWATTSRVWAANTSTSTTYFAASTSWSSSSRPNSRSSSTPGSNPRRRSSTPSWAKTSSRQCATSASSVSVWR